MVNGSVHDPIHGYAASVERDTSWRGWPSPKETPDAALVLADRAREHIVVGGFPPLSRLPTERQFAEQFELSRNTVRRAMRLLVDQGLVTTEYGRFGGTRVVEQAALVSALKEVVGGPRRGRVRRIRQQLDQLFEHRLLLEPAAARLAAERSSDRQRQQLSEAARSTVTDLFTYQRADDAVHHQIAESTGNAHLARAIQEARRDTFRIGNVWWMGADWLRVYPDTGAAERAFTAEHSACVNAITQGRVRAAERAMADHLRQSRDQFEALLG